MKKFLAMLALASLSTLALAGVTAIWTGRGEPGFSVTGQSVWRCEYRYGAETFWFTMRTPCRGSIELE